MKALHELLNEWPSEQIIEMATISKSERWGNNLYRIAVHGTAAGDRETPHIHIYLSNDKKPYNNFNFEVSLIDIICYNEFNLIYQRDVKTGKLSTNRSKCSWEGYRKIKEGFEDWLFDKCNMPGEFINNLDALIYWWNQESDSNSDNPLKDYIDKKGLHILPEYKIYFE